MPRLTVRRRDDGTAFPTGVVALGLALGAAAGFLLGEWLGPRATRVVRPRPSLRPSVAELVHDAQEALAADLRLRDCRLEVVPVGRNALELHGWVPDRRARRHAETVVSATVTVERLVNCLLVRGEDDLPDADLVDDAGLVSA